MVADAGDDACLDEVDEAVKQGSKANRDTKTNRTDHVLKRKEDGIHCQKCRLYVCKWLGRRVLGQAASQERPFHIHDMKNHVARMHQMNGSDVPTGRGRAEITLFSCRGRTKR